MASKSAAIRRKEREFPVLGGISRPSRQDFKNLIAPISQELEEAKRIYIESLLETGVSDALDEVLTESENRPGVSRPLRHQLIAGMAEYMRQLEGKWFRPALVLFSTDLFGGDRKRAAVIAAALELIHNATLIHDDIIDESDMRRGSQAVWKQWGNSATVLMGDLLYAKAFELTTGFGDIAIQRVIAEATGRMCQGELQQLESSGNIHVTEQEYLQVISLKTACLISACTQCGAMIAGADAEAVDLMRRFGLSLGMTFQIVDDVLDFVADPKELGKTVGNDLARGKVTLPLIHCISHTENPEPVINLLTGADGDAAFDLSETLNSCQSIEYAYQRACRYGQQAERLLDSLERFEIVPDRLKHLERLVDFVVSRKF